VCCVFSRDGNTGQPALFKPSPLLARQKQGGAGQLEGVGSNSHPTPPKGGLASWRAGPSIFKKKKNCRLLLTNTLKL